MELVLKDAQSALTVSETIFGRDFNEVLIYQIVVAYAAGTHQGTRAQKTHTEVADSGKEPWRQKSAGRARSGSIKNPTRRPGSVAFAVCPQSHNQKVNKRVYRGVLRSILSELVRQDHLIVVEKFSVEAPKTKLLTQKLRDMALEDVLIIIGELDENLSLTTHNLHKVDVYDATDIDPASLTASGEVVMIADTVK